MTATIQPLDRVVIRFAGDSGDGMQLTGDRFTTDAALLGNDLSTLPNFPAEIRAPQGTLPGVSSFQLHFADHDVLTPGDRPDVLVAMNPAALKANLPDLPRGATVIVDTDEFGRRNLAKVGYAVSPLEDGTLEAYAVHPVALTSITVEALADHDLTRKDKERAKNMFALGLLSWLYTRPIESTERFLTTKFGSKPDLLAANLAALRAGFNYGETTEEFAVRYEVGPAPMPAGRYRNVTGNIALSYGLVTAAHKANLPLVLGSYPITPASDILHTLAGLKRFGVTTIQAEDEIAGVGSSARRRLRRRTRRHDDVRPGAGPQGRDHRPRGVARAAAHRVRHPARRPVDGTADQDRAGRPAAGVLRSQRRVPGRRRRAAVPLRLLRHRARRRPDRDDLPHAGDHPLRRLPRQRLRAVAGAVGRRAAGRDRSPTPPRRTPSTPRAIRSSTPTCATRRPWPARGPSRAPPASSTASAVSRRPTSRATSPTTRPTTTS